MVSLSSLRITLIRNSSGAWPVIYLMLVCCCCNAAEWNTAQCVSNFSSWVLSIDVLLWGDCRRCGAVLFLPFTAAVSVVFNIITALVSPQQPVWLHPQQGLCLDIYYGLCICVCECCVLVDAEVYWSQQRVNHSYPHVNKDTLWPLSEWITTSFITLHPIRQSALLPLLSFPLDSLVVFPRM